MDGNKGSKEGVDPGSIRAGPQTKSHPTQRSADTATPWGNVGGLEAR